MNDERTSCAGHLTLLGASKTPNTAVSSQLRRRAIDSELESDDNVMVGDGDTDVESDGDSEEDLPTRNLSQRRQKMMVEVRRLLRLGVCDLFARVFATARSHAR
jgi:hypothetical protein